MCSVWSRGQPKPRRGGFPLPPSRFHQIIVLTCIDHLYMILQSKPKKGSSPTSSSIPCAVDPESEIYGSLDVDEPVDHDRTRMFLPHVFPQGVPHMKYQRLTQLSGGRLFFETPTDR